jgi:hypothetical protein
MHDRDLDPAVPSRAAWQVPDLLSPAAYQRLVANPFLAFAGLLAWGGAIDASVRSGRLAYFIPALLSGLALPLLWQYHCLDCGRTGHVAYWRSHHCQKVEERRRQGRPRRFRGPTPATQTKLWLLALTSIGALALLTRYG